MALKQVANDFQLEVNEENLEVDVEVNYRCYFDTDKALYPMIVSGSIFKGHNLTQFIQEHKQNYENDYLKVEVVQVFADI